ncbi:hypothetical protein HCN56_16655, partial [Streptomyces lonarensis]|nr:hypothetical protein [Streptomyces lonarensis]
MRRNRTARASAAPSPNPDGAPAPPATPGPSSRPAGPRRTRRLVVATAFLGGLLAAVFLYSGSMSTSGIVAAQEDRWFVVLLPVSF